MDSLLYTKMTLTYGRIYLVPKYKGFSAETSNIKEKWHIC